MLSHWSASCSAPCLSAPRPCSLHRRAGGLDAQRAARCGLAFGSTLPSLLLAPLAPPWLVCSLVCVCGNCGRPWARRVCRGDCRPRTFPLALELLQGLYQLLPTHPFLLRQHKPPASPSPALQRYFPGQFSVAVGVQRQPRVISVEEAKRVSYAEPQTGFKPFPAGADLAPLRVYLRVWLSSSSGVRGLGSRGSWGSAVVTVPSWQGGCSGLSGAAFAPATRGILKQL